MESKIHNHYSYFSRLLGGHNWYSLGFLSSWPASLAAIFLERPSRRGALSIYVCYIVSFFEKLIQAADDFIYFFWCIKSLIITQVPHKFQATEAILETYRRSGTLPSIPGFNSVCFGILSSILIYIQRKKLSFKSIKTSKPETKAQSDGKDVVFSLLRFVSKMLHYQWKQKTWNKIVLNIYYPHVVLA